MIDVSAGLSDSIHKQIDASYYPDGWRRYMARAIKEVFPDKIVMTSGNIRNPQMKFVNVFLVILDVQDIVLD